MLLWLCFFFESIKSQIYLWASTANQMNIIFHISGCDSWGFKKKSEGRSFQFVEAGWGGLREETPSVTWGKLHPVKGAISFCCISFILESWFSKTQRGVKNLLSRLLKCSSDSCVSAQTAPLSSKVEFPAVIRLLVEVDALCSDKLVWGWRTPACLHLHSSQFFHVTPQTEAEIIEMPKTVCVTDKQHSY